MPASGETVESFGASSSPTKSDNSVCSEIDLVSRELSCLPTDITSTISPSVTTLLLDHNELSSLPQDFGKMLPNLQVLSVTGNLLKRLPDSIGCLACLKEIYINDNEIDNLSDSFCKLRSLEVFKVSGNEMTSFPQKFGDLRHLKVLNADENQLQSLPTNLGLMDMLEILECSDNEIKFVPQTIGKLKKLRILNLCSNKIENIPDALGDLSNLEAVDLTGNFIETLPYYFNSTLSLKKLYVDSNKLAVIPEWLSELTEISEICLKDNRFQHQVLTDRFGDKCKKLRVLDMGGNFMTQLPDSIGKLQSLEVFCLGSVIDELERRAFQNGNWLMMLPDSICDLKNLKELHLDENLFQELPSDFGNLINLEFLDLGQNLLHELPESFGNLKSLRICQLSKNKLELLPSSFGNLTALEDLRLDNNALAELPECFCKLINLKTLDLFNNRLTEVPTAIKYFTKLVRMDLQENHFDIPWDEVPQIMKSAKYPQRDPTLKNNWRGRPRQDLTLEDFRIKQMPEVEHEDEEENENDEPLSGYSNREDLFRMAAARSLSSSIWRSHTGPSKREKFVRHGERNRHVSHTRPSDSESGDEEEQTDIYCCSDEDFEPPIFTPKIRNKEDENLEKEKTVEVNDCEENWDDELEDVPVDVENPYGTFNSLYCHAPPKTLAEAGYVVDEYLFLPYDIHSQPVIKPCIRYTVENGQFDDDEDDDDQEGQS